jgi:hypothetical protein
MVNDATDGLTQEKYVPPLVWCAALYFALLAGCGALSPRPPPGDFAPDPGSGIVVGSVTSPVFSTGTLQLVRWNFRSSADPSLRGFFDSAALFNPYAPLARTTDCNADGLAELCGRLFAVELPADTYTFHTVSIAVASPGWEHPQPKGFHFTVTPGAITYIGNLDTAICWGAASASGNGVLGAVGRVTDAFERDWPLLVAKFPGLAGAAIERRLVSGDTWRWALGWREGRQVPSGWGACTE